MKNVFRFFPLLFLISCGETNLDKYEEAETGRTISESSEESEYTIVAPQTPPFIIFNGDLGDIDDFTYEEDVPFPTTPIEELPDIF
jgi:hypothetical protein